MARVVPTRVALVPYNDPLRTEWIDHRNLLQVAAALQAQAVRDLYPIWKVSAVISPFLDLTDVPPGYATIVILPEDPPPPGDPPFGGPLGFHMVQGSTPVGVVKYADDWSLFASHELLEMLCDPFGTRTESGLSLGAGQGKVDYLVEVCDPCQHSTYTIDGVLVSDFVTPEYYGPVAGSGTMYSFTGRVTQPRELLDGGYLTWSTLAPGEEIWQAFAPAGNRYQAAVASRAALEIGPLLAARLSREWIDSHTTSTDAGAERPGPNSRLQGTQPLSDAQAAFANAGLAATRNGTELHGLITNILRALHPRFKLLPAETEKLLDKLASPAGQTAFLGDPDAALAKIVDPPAELVLPSPPAGLTLAPPPRYTAAWNTFTSASRFGMDFSQPELAGLTEWLCYLGGF